MRPTARSYWLILFALSFAALPAGAAGPAIEFKDGDRIVFVGNDFFERELDQGYLETQLTTRFPEKKLIFRNLGYAGDTVFADARNLCAGWENFGPADQGFKRLKGLVAHLRPTVVFVAYGMNESFEGEPGVANFQHGLERMLDMLAAGQPRIVLISPIRHEDLGRPMPDPLEHNRQLGLYIAAMASEAARRGYPFVDLYAALGDGAKGNPPAPFTRDGIHLNAYGYWRAAQAIEQGLGFPSRAWRAEIDAEGKVGAADGTRITHVSATSGSLSFQAEDALLPVALEPGEMPPRIPAPNASLPGTQRILKITGLKPGHYVLKCGDAIAAGSAELWAAGLDIRGGPAYRQIEELRQLIRLKNIDFFNYWRPENDTYIFGYRNHEQGRNAVEVPEFEPLAASKDAQIGERRVPQAVTYTLTAE